MTKLLNRSLRKFTIYAGLVLVASIPIYYLIISRLWQYELDEHKIVLTTEADREDAYLIIAIVTSLSIVFFALLMIGFVWLNRRISKQLWKPFYNTLEQIRHFDLDRQHEVIFIHTDIQEFSELNESLEKLIAGSIAAYSQQKEFADNASHELQTPLAIIQSKLDLLMQTKSLTTDQYEIIEDAVKALSRVTRINKNLLLLTKIENSQFMEKEEIGFSSLVRNTIALLGNFADAKGLIIQANIAEEVKVEGNPMLVEILLSNLLTNAIRYSADGEKILIQLSADNLTISNPGVASLNQEQLFKRFSNSFSQSPGTGLGLALVKQISDRYGWKVFYSYNNRLHIFTLSFCV